MAGYGNLFETDTESLLNELNTFEQQKPAPTQMNNSAYPSYSQMQQQQQNQHNQMAHMQHPQHGHNANMAPGMQQQQQQYHQQQQPYNPQQYQQYYQNQQNHQQLATLNQKTQQQQQQHQQQQQNPQQGHQINGAVPNPINATSYMHSPMAPPPPPQPPPTGAQGTQQGPTPPPPQSPKTPPNANNTTTIQNVQINVQNNFNIAKNNLNQYGAGSGAAAASPSATSATLATNNNNTNTNTNNNNNNGNMLQSAGANSNPWSMPTVNSSSYQSQASMVNMSAQQQQQYKQQQMLQQQQMYKMNQYNLQKPVTPPQLPSNTPPGATNNPNLYNSPNNQLQKPVQGQYPTQHTGYPNHQYQNGSMQGAPGAVGAVKMTPIPNHMQQQQVNQQQPYAYSNPNQNAPNMAQQRQHSPQSAYSPSPNKIVNNQVPYGSNGTAQGVPNPNVGINVNQTPTGGPPQSSPNRHTTGQFFNQQQQPAAQQQQYPGYPQQQQANQQYSGYGQQQQYPVGYNPQNPQNQQQKMPYPQSAQSPINQANRMGYNSYQMPVGDGQNTSMPGSALSPPANPVQPPAAALGTSPETVTPTKGGRGKGKNKTVGSSPDEEGKTKGKRGKKKSVDPVKPETNALSPLQPMPQQQQQHQSLYAQQNPNQMIRPGVPQPTGYPMQNQPPPPNPMSAQGYNPTSNMAQNNNLAVGASSMSPSNPNYIQQQQAIRQPSPINQQQGSGWMPPNVANPSQINAQSNIHGTPVMNIQQPHQHSQPPQPQQQQPYNAQAPNMHLNQFTTQPTQNTGAAPTPPVNGQLPPAGYPNQYQMNAQGPQQQAPQIPQGLQAPHPQATAQGFVKKPDDPSFTNTIGNIPKPQVAPVNAQFNLPAGPNTQMIQPNQMQNGPNMPGQTTGQNNVKLLPQQSNINMPINQANTVVSNNPALFNGNQSSQNPQGVLNQQTVLIKQQGQAMNSTASPQMIPQQQQQQNQQHQIVQQTLSSQTIPFIPTTQTVQMMPNKPTGQIDQTKPLDSLGQIVQLQQNPQQMAGMNQQQPGGQQVFLGGQTASFIDQQQQLIQDNLNPKPAEAATASPAKKLTKKQLKKLNAGEDPSAETTPTKKTPKQRKIVPKKDSLNNSLSSSGSQTDLNKEGINGEGEAGATGDPSQQAKIDATIDDFMKQYKMKTKKSKKKTDKDELNDSDAIKMETDPESDDSLFNDENLLEKKGTKSRPKKPKAKKFGDDSTDETVVKKPKYTKKKTIAQTIDEQGQPIVAAETTPSISTLTTPSAAPQIAFHLQAPELPSIVQKASGGRKKSSMNLAKLMKKNGRKKRKKTSSGEEEDDDDDSDEFEIPVKKSKSKAKNDLNAIDEATMENESQNDEETAKALQASENKRRSTRTNKRTKYTSEEYAKFNEMNNADLIIPPTEEELAAERAQDAANAEAANSNIVLTTAENLVIDKILGVRLFKRKTRRKKEKPVKVNIDEDARAALEDVLFEIEKAECKAKGEPEPEKEPIIREEDEAELSEWEDDGGEIEVEEFYVKYKSFSYLHCEWRTREEIYMSDKRIDQKIKRFRLKKSQEIRYEWEDPDGYANGDEELFNSDYTTVDRILDVFDMADPAKPGEFLRYYLIKWKTLPYEESSWELSSDVKNQKKIDRFYSFNICEEIHRKHVPKPRPEKWAPMKESRVYNAGNTIREYQLEGINWLIFCWLNSRNCILADEMGLGKTIQSLTFCKEMSMYGVHGPFLILVPLSTIGNWIREFELWTDFNCIVYHGSSASKQMLQDYEFYFVDQGTTPNKSNSFANEPVKNATVKFNALITTYEVLLADVAILGQFKWRSCIIDEAHRLKNKNCRLIEGLRYMDIEHKVLLTGTPLQNNVEELFSLLNFLEPLQFSSSTEFMKEFGILQTDTQVSKLQAILKPMMLRRLKEDVEKNLAPKEETIVEVELTNTQKKYYRAILEKNFQFLSRGASSSNVPNLMNTMMELRKCCNHPYLISGSEDQIIAEYKEKDQNSLDPDAMSVQAMIQASGKLVLVDKLLPKLKADGHKVLIFSQMIRVLDIIEDYLINKRFTYERIDGRIRGELRQEAIDRYSKKDSDKFVFLLCTRAGGLGINLTAADTVIIYDSDWNPQNDLQAQARCHRIGQKKNVTIYRLITTNTYEREMFDKASLKLGLDKAILQSMRNEDKFNQRENQPINPNIQLSKKEIEDLLKKGAYGSIMEDDTAADKFCEDDIDTLLSKRSTVVQIEGGEKGSTFSKASFQTADTADINIDDPDFWIKWAKKADIDVEEKLNPADERIIYEPRQRRQTRRFGGPDDILDSDLDSSSSDGDENKDPNNADPKNKDKKKGKRSKRNKDTNVDVDYEGNSNEAEELFTKWSRDECYKVEKNLLTFGWGRWPKIRKNCEFSSKKKGGVQSEQDVESLSRCIVTFALKLFHGDELVKQCILELVDPSKSKYAELRTGGLSGPAVSRGRNTRGRKDDVKKNEETDVKMEEDIVKKDEDPAVKTEGNEVKMETDEPKSEKLEPAEPELTQEQKLAYLESLEWAKGVEDLLADETYKKHLIRQANRILLKLKTLHYIQNEIIGAENAIKLDEDENIDLEKIIVQLPDYSTDLPKEWWDKSCDRSMIIGVHLHGYEKYSKMRSDPKLCFLQLCGLPDAKDLLAEIQQQQQEDNNEENPEGADNEQVDVENNSANPKNGDDNASNLKTFPTITEFNNRLRKLITAHQKIKRQNEIISKRNAERQEKRLSKLASTQERAVMRQMEKQSKWSRREEQNFYRTISTFGVDSIGPNLYAWDRFREIGQLDKKLDETLNDYFIAFFFMCKKICHKLTDDDKLPPHLVDFQVEVISEERATRCIQRVDLLNKVRQDVFNNQKFEEWILNCLPSPDLPDWWIACKHDADLIRAACRYGITRTEYYYVIDTQFTFKEYLNKYMVHIDKLMHAENKEFNDPTRNIDPIQYYFQNQSKIQMTFKNLLRKSEEKTTEPTTPEEETDETAIENLMKELVKKTVIEIEGEDTEPGDSPATEESLKKEELPVEEPIEQDKAELPSFFGNMGTVPMIMWPKDRVLFNRLEMIIQMFENNGEWPQRMMHIAPNGNGNQQNPLSISNLVNPSHASLIAEQRKHMLSPSVDFNGEHHPMENDENSNSESDFNGQKNAKPKRGRPPKYDPSVGMSDIYKRSSHTGVDSKDGYSSEDYDDLDHKTDEQAGAGSKRAGFLEPGEILRPSQKIKHGNQKSDDQRSSSTKRGRKPSIIHPKSPPLAQQAPEMSNQDAATAAALAAMFLAPGQDPDERISVINVETGARIVGNRAPKRSELPMWLISHPNYLPDESEIINLALKQSQQAIAPESQQENLNTSSRRGSKSLKQSHMVTPHDEREEDSSSPKSDLLKSQEGPSSKFNNNSKNRAHGRDSPAQGSSGNAPMAVNVILFNKNTGKKLPQQKLPSWKSLCAFLDRNQQVFIDPKSNDLIRAKFGSRQNIPDIIKSRQINPSSKSMNGQQDKQQSQHGTPSESSSKSPPPRMDRKGKTSSSSSSKALQQSEQEAEMLKQQQQLMNMLGNPFAQMNQMSPNSTAQLQGFSDLLAASGAGAAGGGNPAEQMQNLQAMMTMMAAGQAPNAAFNGLGNPAAAGGFNPFMMPPFNAGLPSTSNTPEDGMPPGLADMLKLMGGKMPPGLDMTSFDELTNSIASNPFMRQQAPDSPSAKSTCSTSSNHEKPSKNDQMKSSKQNRDGHSTKNSTPKPEERTNSRKSKNPTSIDQKNQESKQREQQQKRDEQQRPASTSSSTSNTSRVNESKYSSKKPSSSKPNENQTPEQTALAALIAQSGLQLDQNTNMAAIAQMMEQEKMLQDMMALGQLGAGGLPPGMDPSMLTALASNPFLFGAGQNNFSTPQLPSPQVNSKSSMSSSKKQKSSRNRSPSPPKERERSVSPASSVTSNMSQQQQQQQPDFNMFMNNLMMGGGMPPPPMGLGPLGMPNDLSQMPPELLAALSAAAAGGAAPGGVGSLGGMPGLDPSMFSALAQLSNLSSNAQSEEGTPNLKEKSRSRLGSSNGSSLSKHQKHTPNGPSSSRHSMGTPSSHRQSMGSKSSMNYNSPQVRKSSKPQDDGDTYQGLDLSKKLSKSVNPGRERTDKDEPSTSSHRKRNM